MAKINDRGCLQLLQHCTSEGASVQWVLIIAMLANFFHILGPFRLIGDDGVVND